MFPTRFRSRQAILISCFVVLCIFPTFVSLCLAAWHNQPGQHAQYEAQLTSLLAVDCSIKKIEHESPGNTLFQEVLFHDLENGELLASVTSLRVTEKSDKLLVIADELQFSVSQLPRIKALVNRLIQDAKRFSNLDLEFQASQVTCDLITHRQTFALVSAHWNSTSQQTNLVAEFSLDAKQATEPIQFHVTRLRNEKSNPTWNIALDTKGISLPITYFLDPKISRQWLSNQANFSGAFKFSNASNVWKGSVQGELTSVDLNQLVTENFPHQLTGKTSIVLNKIMFESGKLKHGEIYFHADQGLIGTSLLTQCVHALGMQVNPNINASTLR